MIIVALLGVLILFSLSVFQILLILGKPLGNYAWGGQHEVLPNRLRVGSVFSIMLYIVFSILLVSKAGLVDIIPDGLFLSVAIWVVTGYSVLGIFMNAISRSKKERLLMTPVVLLLAVIFLVVAVS